MNTNKHESDRLRKMAKEFKTLSTPHSPLTPSYNFCTFLSMKLRSLSMLLGVFQPEANKISIHAYNPALDKFKNGPSSRFDLDYPMALPPVSVPGPQ